jgi:hypothetical protein
MSIPANSFFDEGGGRFFLLGLFAGSGIARLAAIPTGDKRSIRSDFNCGEAQVPGQRRANNSL